MPCSKGNIRVQIVKHWLCPKHSEKGFLLFYSSLSPIFIYLLSDLFRDRRMNFDVLIVPLLKGLHKLRSRSHLFENIDKRFKTLKRDRRKLIFIHFYIFSSCLKGNCFEVNNKSKSRKRSGILDITRWSLSILRIICCRPIRRGIK